MEVLLYKGRAFTPSFYPPSTLRSWRGDCTPKSTAAPSIVYAVVDLTVRGSGLYCYVVLNRPTGWNLSGACIGWEGEHR